MKVNIGVRFVGKQHEARLLLAGVEQPPNMVLPLRASELAQVLSDHLVQGWRIHERYGQTTARPMDQADAHDGDG